MTTVYCDESVWLPVAKGLRQRGWDVRTATEEDRLGETDKESYVLLTITASCF